MTPEEMAYYKGYTDGRDNGKVAGYNLGRLHGKIAGLKVAHNNFTDNVIIDGWDYKTLHEYQEWLEQKISELENEK